ncbi:MAG: GAF domain-containing protein [Polyangiaceae bacterium]|nr:GAF domain-containing protein [Polyangiaceae bacterium]
MNSAAASMPVLSLLRRASQVILSTHDSLRLPQVIVEVSMSVMAADTATLLVPGVDGSLYVAYAQGLDPAVQKAIRIAPGQGIAGRVAQTLEPLVINGDAPGERGRGRSSSSRVRASIVYPISSGSDVLGVLTFNRLDDGRPYSEDDLETASVLASHVMLALETRRLAHQVCASEKLAAVGQLAAGVAHEVNTPVQFISDSAHFLRQAFADMQTLLAHFGTWRDRLATGESIDVLAQELAQLEEELEPEHLLAEIPKAISRVADGAARVSEVVRAVKDFGRPGLHDLEHVDLRQSILSTLTVAHREYDGIAEVETHFEEMPLVPCNPSEINHVLLNLLVNAAHAVADTGLPASGRGRICVRAFGDGGDAVVSVEDNGVGIAPEIQHRIFEPFFTTREVGRGSGLGLATSRAAVVDRHGGSLTFVSEPGRGTKFTMRLPVRPQGEQRSGS